MSAGKQIIDSIIRGGLCSAECAHDKDHGCVIVWSSGAAEQLEALLRDEPWTREPPTEQGPYWYWNGDQTFEPVMLWVMLSGTSGKCFIPETTDPLTRNVDDPAWAGWWKRANVPATP